MVDTNRRRARPTRSARACSSARTTSTPTRSRTNRTRTGSSRRAALRQGSRVGVMELRQALIAKTLRVPAVEGPAGDGAAVARQFDVALLSVGFKGSRELLEHLSGLHPAVAQEIGGDRARRRPRAGRRPRAATTPTSSTSRPTCPTRSTFWVGVHRGGAAGPAHGGQHRDPARAARGQPARPAVLRPLPAHLRGAAGRARRADRRGGRPHDRARPRRARWPRSRTRCTCALADERHPALGATTWRCWACSPELPSATRSRRRSRSARAAPWSTARAWSTGWRWSVDTPSTCCGWRARCRTAT